MSAPTVSSSTPERSLEQRMEALARGNEIRLARAQLKRDLKAGRVAVAAILENPPGYAAGMKAFDLLVASPKWGRVKAGAAMTCCRAAHSKTLGGLTDRQRADLVGYVKGGPSRVPSEPTPAQIAAAASRAARQALEGEIDDVHMILVDLGPSPVDRVAAKAGLSERVVRGHLATLRARGRAFAEWIDGRAVWSPYNADVA